MRVIGEIDNAVHRERSSHKAMYVHTAASFVLIPQQSLRTGPVSMERAVKSPSDQPLVLFPLFLFKTEYCLKLLLLIDTKFIHLSLWRI